MFCGVNNHHNSILFASAILANEVSDSFIWLFAELKKCMSKTPQTIITDQDPTMNVALATELLDTFHRHCIWHITYKICDKVGSVYRNKEQMERFHNILHCSDSVMEFQELSFLDTG